MSHNTESIFRAHIDAERKDENLTRYQHVAGNRASLARRRTEVQWRRFEESKARAARTTQKVHRLEDYGVLVEHDLPAEGYPLWSKKATRPEPGPLRPYHLTAYGATQEQAESVLRDQSEDRPSPRYFVVGYEHPTKGTRYYVQNQQRQRVSFNATAERATAWATLFEAEHPRYADLVDEADAEHNLAPRDWQ